MVTNPSPVGCHAIDHAAVPAKAPRKHLPRVLVVAHQALPHIGGLEVLVDLEVRQLARRGCEVVLVTSDPGAGLPERPIENVHVIRVPAWHVVERRFSISYPIFSPTLFPVLWRQLTRADIVHVHGFVFMNSALALVMARLLRKPSILTDHGGKLHYRSRLGTWLLRAAIETIGRISARCATRLIAYNADVAALLSRLAGKKAKLSFLANPVDRSRFHVPTPQQRQAARCHFVWDGGRTKVLFVGRLVADKGIDLLLAAADPSYDLVFCGPGKPDTIQRIIRSGAEHVPPRPHEQMTQMYHAADLLALPSWNEGFPVVIQEALACGLRVVTSDHQGYTPYQQLQGLHLCPLDPEAIRQILRQVLATDNPTHSDLLRDAPMHLTPTFDQWLDTLFADGLNAVPNFNSS